MSWSTVSAVLILLKLVLSDAGGDTVTESTCVDSDPKCSLWASQGECQSNAVWMMANCRRSCQSCQGGDRAWQLRTHLSSTYTNSTSNATRNVNIESVRINHVEVDETKQTVRAYGRMVLSWNDSKVAWDKDEWGISWLNFYWIQVWTPQLLQINSPNSIPGIVTGKVLAANYTGQVYMWTDFNFVAPYHFQYEDYPNDYQRICYKFDDKRYFSVRFHVSPEVKTRKHEALGESHVSGWTIEDMEVNDSKYVIEILGDWKQNPYDVQTNNCELCLSLRRNSIYYLTEMLIPAFVTSIITLGSVLFQLSTVQPVLLAFSILAQILSLIIINSRLPSFAEVTPTILKYAGFNMTSTAILFMLSLILRKLSQVSTNIPPPRFLDTFVRFIDRLIPLPNEGKDAEDTLEGQYSHIAHTLNNLAFSFFCLVYFLVMTFSFIF